MQLLKDQAYEGLLEMIRNGQIKYDKLYSLNALASEMQMSRTPVRDAIQRLCEEGRMDMLPSRGFRLHKMNREEILQHYHFSNAIEGYCISCLADAYKKGERTGYVEKMQDLLDNMEKRLGDDVPFDEYFPYDKGFHLVIMESLEDPYFSSLQYSAMGFYDHPELQYSEAISRRDIFACHKKILECVKSGDAHGAFDAMIDHAKLMMRPVLGDIT